MNFSALLLLAAGPLFFGVLFGVSFWLEPRRLFNGVLFNLFALVLLICLAFGIISSQNRLLIAVTGTLFVIFVMIIALLFALHLLWLLWNAFLVWRREGHSLGNMLTLLIALGLIGLELGATFGQNILPTWLYNGLGVFITLGGAYILFSLYNFLTVLILYNLRFHRYRQDYLIVLGAGLLNGDQVSPLLASRIDAGIRFYQKQQARHRTQAPMMIFSGGQGIDEKLPEGVAMQRYAIAHGIPAAHTLVEDRSTTTFENMRFSKRLIETRQAGKLYHATFFTNNYHLFRAGLYARLAGLAANGVGSPTSFYFLPNAVIREYLAILVLYKRRHLIFFGIIALLSLLTMLSPWITSLGR